MMCAGIRAFRNKRIIEKSMKRISVRYITEDTGKGHGRSFPFFVFCFRVTAYRNLYLDAVKANCYNPIYMI